MDTSEAAAVRRVLVAIEQQDWQALRLLLHPYLHWTQPEGRVIRGRNKVLAYLKSRRVGAPTQYELRDGQIYRWVSGL
jgi:hypothetical protein